MTTNQQTSHAIDVKALADGVRAGHLRAVARAITLIESSRLDHRLAAEDLINDILPDTGHSVRLGISGVPGVGKSTFIESFGLHIVNGGHRVAVLAVDPSSPRTGGSILGDKTRMEELSRHPNAYIRPSPSGNTLGGVARRTREAMLVCEAAGYDVVLVETVGVGQSETAVANMTDLFMLLLAPGTGDELQGIKKGIVELADVVVVNKADGDLAMAAERVRRDYSNALHLLRPASSNWAPPVLKCSSLALEGIVDVWKSVLSFREICGKSGEIQEKRARQAVSWMWNEVSETLMSRLQSHEGVALVIEDLVTRVEAGGLPPTDAARSILQRFLGQ